jgi:predicted outer membrane protein
MSRAASAGMRNLLLTPFLISLVAVMPACSDDDDFDGFDDADAAAADGEFLGAEHARQADLDFADDSDELVIAKSAGIMIAIDEGEIMLADFALQFAIEPIVLDYALFMIDEHTAHLDQIDQLLIDFDIVPVETTISANLRAEAEGVLRNLQIAFDVDYEYMRSQIMMHAEAFVIVDTLAFNSPFVEWTRFFQDTLLIIDDHLVEAQLILRSL